MINQAKPTIEARRTALQGFFNPVKENFILGTDAYKLTHWLQDPDETETKYSYLESRGGQFDHTIFFGLQYILKQYFVGQVVTKAMVAEAEDVAFQVFDTKNYFNRKGWDHIVNKHGGTLPLRIKAVLEGTRVPTQNVLMTVENTDENCSWLTQGEESKLLKVWAPTTVCTLSNEIRRLVSTFAKETGSAMHPFYLNDFGYRGVSSEETAAINGGAHLVNFQGTDNLPAIRMLQELYQGGRGIGKSVIASEHSTTTIYGKDAEVEAFRRFIKQADPSKIVSIVVDSYDTLHAVSQLLGKELRDEILARPGKVVFRPDSGTPEHMAVEVINYALHAFGGATNSKGYQELNPKVGVLYGDGINYGSIKLIMENLVRNKLAVSNLVLGMGGALLQQPHRDTQQFAMKCSSAQVAGVSRDVYKKPKTDVGKNSKRGRLQLNMTSFGQLATYQEGYENPDLLVGPNKLVTVFENGELLVDQSLTDIQARASA